MTIKYLSETETAKLVRVRLRDDFPGVKFSVRTHSYSGGATIRVGWTDGPRTADVERSVGCFDGRGFDGSIDMAYDVERYVRDGRVVGTRTMGTQGSMGCVPAHDDAVDGAELVRFGASYMSLRREFASEELRRDLVARAMQMINSGCVVRDGKFGGTWVDDLANGMANDRDADGSLDGAFRRIVLRERECAPAACEVA